MCHYRYPAYPLCKHPDNRKRHGQWVLPGGWEAHIVIERCEAQRWAGGHSTCPRPSSTTEPTEDWKWVASPSRGLGRFCPACETDARTSSETLLPVRVMLLDLKRNIQEWQESYGFVLTSSNIMAMQRDKDWIEDNYHKATMKGPYNTAESGLREDFFEFIAKWESFIEEKIDDRDRWEREHDGGGRSSRASLRLGDEARNAGPQTEFYRLQQEYDAWRQSLAPGSGSSSSSSAQASSSSSSGGQSHHHRSSSSRSHHSRRHRRR
ncbi:hypothetical protein M406DRAFT_68722 [Cryphonectria parasitica EP155]|uniref:Uncharacterized protein n=1 Tax=Cryphonectria parasitica (strain ATCC 38755 / EP155) TaxID=660469 RepID=A0A9P4Y4H9_CRYP1|nr:uncharacterized protein M406DRAFT_68722 [Cryphonectria parasitica EP155]KAF3766376.1 hypothetical protein M406DRAFT_68722 [Cryphonectria parasitica EP155]